MSEFSIPPALIQETQNGAVALFLGAGANRAALHPTGTPPMPTGNELRDLICNHFYEGANKDRALPTVASYIRNEFGSGRLEGWIAEYLKQYTPSTGHKLIPRFRWQAIYFPQL